jgi:hypothetical protein
MLLTEEEFNNSKYKEDIKYFMTNKDLKKILGDDLKMIKFAHLDTYDNIYQILIKKIDYCIILTESQFNSGHWQLLLKYNDKIEYFDSYGDKPSTILKFIPKSMNIYLDNNYNEDMGNILNSINDKNKNLIINKYKFQSYVNDINTCGRWIAYRIQLHLLNYNNKQFYKLIEEYTNKYNLKSDELICELIKV